MPHFYFAIGGKPSPADLAIALLCGQRHFLVPFATPMERRLRALAMLRDDLHMVLDSRAWPPGDPHRPSLAAYHQAILAWQQSDRLFSSLDFAISYDHIGDSARSLRDYTALLRMLCASSRTRRGAFPALVPVLQYPASPLEAGRLLEYRWPDGYRTSLPDDATTGQSPATWLPPVLAIGGMVPHRYSRKMRAWWDGLLQALAAPVPGSPHDSYHLTLHILGITRPDWVCDPWGLVRSVDSSGPARMAALGGWTAISRNFHPAYGLPPDALQQSRAARLAYWILAYRDRLGLPWAPVDAEAVLAIAYQDKGADAPVQLSLFAA